MRLLDSLRRLGSALALGGTFCAGLALPVGASPIEFDARLTISLGPFGSFDGLGSGTAELLPDGTLQLPGHIISVSGTSTAKFGLLTLRADVQGIFPFRSTVSFAPGEGFPGGGFGERFVGILGAAGIGWLTTPSDTSPLPLGSLPLQLLGNGGTFPFPPRLPDLSTLTGAWTTGTVMRSFALPSGTLTTVTVSGFDARTPGGLGLLRLVNPPTIFDFAGSEVFPAYATLDLQFVPEPGAALLLVSGGLFLALVGRRQSTH